MTKKLVLIDGHALVHRAFHALPPTMSSPSGFPTNAVYGFLSVLIKTIKDIRPDYIVATFDLAGPTFRHEEFADYKAHREKAPDGLHAQVPIVKELLNAFGIPIYEKEGFEADDLIGSIAEIIKKNKDIQTIIATGDLDTLQLVEGDKVVVFTLKKGVTDTVIYNEKEVNKRYGLKPEQVVDFKGLKGDPSDNIPGVPGVGEKTAAMLIQKFGSIENLYENITEKQNEKSKAKKGEISEKLIQKLIDNKDMAFFSKKLATIIRDVPVDFNMEKADWHKNMRKEELAKMLQDLGIYSLLKRINEIDDTVLEQPELIEKISSDNIKVTTINTKEQAEKFIAETNSYNSFALDISIDPELKGPGYLVFARDSRQTHALSWKLIKNKTIFQGLKKILEDKDVKKTGHNLKDLYKELAKEDIKPAGFEFDSKIAGYLINSDLKDYDLDKVYFLELGKNMNPEPLKRPAYLYDLKKAQWEKMKSLDVLWVFEKIEMPLISILAEMELSGIRVDLGAIKKLAGTTTKILAGLEKQIYKLAGEEFNINSPQQLSVVLFDKLRLKGKVRKTGKGASSTAASELEKLSGEHPVVDLIMKYREFQKLNTTYIEPFPELVGNDGRLRTTLNQTGTTTGRLSSQNPNLQNIPIRTELGQEFRKVFVADKGFSLASFDYSQLDLRVVAHISTDKKMVEAFKRGEDVHTRTAAEIFGIEAGKVTANMRRDAKTLNFGILYGMGILGFQRASGVDRAKAKEFIDKYFHEFSGVAGYMQEMKEKVSRDGYVTTIFGRRRQLPEIFSGVPQLVSQAERMAINMPVQGTSADLIKLAMIRVEEAIHAEGSGDEVKMLLQVHDELLFEIKDNRMEYWIPKIRKIMEEVWELKVPLTVDAKYGLNWADMKKVN